MRAAGDGRRRATEQDALAAGFHHGLVEAALELGVEHAVPDLVLAGGVFCNRYLSERLLERAAERGLRVHPHSQLPPTDGSLAAGQLWVAANRVR
jgi:hydrogenase maturation protein HypF